MRPALLLFAPVLASAAGPIVDASWAAQNRARLVVIEAAWLDGKAPEEYRSGHIPGARLLDTDRLESGYPRWLLRPVPELHAVIGSLGIGAASAVLVYGRDAVAPSRVWWVLHYAGVREVYYLNGGLAAWQRAGFPIETGDVAPRPERFQARVRHRALATTEEVRAKLHRRGVQLVDVRSGPEWSGAVSGYRYLEFKGRIPGAKHAGNAGDRAGPYQNPDGTLKDPRTIAELWAGQGIRGDRETVFYCGSGWRSSLTYLYARQLGWSRARNYSDGWTGWSTIHERAPEEAGITPGWHHRRSGNPVE